MKFLLKDMGKSAYKSKVNLARDIKKLRLSRKLMTSYMERKKEFRHIFNPEE